MKKEEFLLELRRQLAGVPEEDMERSIEYYSEMIDDRMEDGIPEEEAVAALGPVNGIVSSILADIPLPKLVRAKVKPGHSLEAWEIVLLVLTAPVWGSLLFAVLVTVFSFYIVIWALVFAFFAVLFAFGAAAIAGVISIVPLALTGNLAAGCVLFGSALILAGFAILMACFSRSIVKGVVRLGKSVYLGIKRCFIRKEKRS